MILEAERVRDQLASRFGDDLRSVGYYDEGDNDHVYIREDIEAEYDAADLENVFREARLEAIDQDHQESLYVHGELQCVLRCFEKAIEVHLIKNQQKGVVAAVETGAIDDLQGTIESAVGAMDGADSAGSRGLF
ncbi:DUF7522 family protein [Natrinema salifodinae]|uniref:Uncharacterized protein n=1 Tax=Natrinema salifodinae TaxID=1202768 RepID=A0A1I0M1P6_9EURY|nr:hypothetical protein [Natrinema salifodinae]SEV81654.1 hypothetical protein SAMN05216285_0249 [Natrinema salifodinae]